MLAQINSSANNYEAETPTQRHGHLTRYGQRTIKHGL